MWPDPAGPVLVVAAHADDEVLGAGGLVALARRSGRPTHLLVLSTAVTSRGLPVADARAIQERRRRDVAAAATVLGAELELHDFPDNAFDQVSAVELTAVVERGVRDLRPSVVVTHWPNDLSTDHRLTAGAVMVACRPQVAATSPTLLAFEVRSSTDWVPAGVGGAFDPGVFVALDEEAWALKVAALRCYASEMRPEPHARSFAGVDALARYRGTQVGAGRAEAFALLRAVISP